MTDSLVLELEPDRDRHASLPGRFYTEPAIFELEKERIFASAWQYAGHASRLYAPGRYITLSFLDEELLFVRGDNGEIEGFHNVCRHRAHRLLEGSGCVSSITPRRLSISPPYDARSEVVCHLMQRLDPAALGAGSTGDREQRE